MIIQIKNEVINLPENKFFHIYKEFSEHSYKNIIRREEPPFFYIIIECEGKNIFDFDNLYDLNMEYKSLLEQLIK